MFKPVQRKNVNTGDLYWLFFKYLWKVILGFLVVLKFPGVVKAEATATSHQRQAESKS